MRSFDAQTWQERAYKRYARAPAHKANAAARRLASDILAIKSIEQVVSWCALEDINVCFAPVDGGGSYTTGLITICSWLSAESQLHVLLHECGHHLLCKRVDLDKRFGKVLKTNTYKVDVIHEELDAWREGKALAHQLGLSLNEARYNRIKTGYVVLYLKWALNG